MRVKTLLWVTLTLIMLVGIGIVAGRSNIQRFGYFIFSFAVWDIFYYIFLKAILNWPESLLTWDILFLIPVIWVGPVLAPVICSLTMICFTLLIIYFDEKTGNACINPIQWILLLTGSFIIIISFVADYIQFMLAHFSQFDTAHYKFFELFNFTQIESLMKYSEQYVPQCFPWWLFLTGELIIIISVILFYINMKKIVSVHVTWSHSVSNEKN
ncbi:MAG: hypothetical protein HY738_14460 [Bacteroidia bacterium]|nr:hypothetical protein [Bacteroidia bacterium]